MKRFFLPAFVALFLASAGATAQSLDDQYVQIFTLIQEADVLSNTRPAEALVKYREAQASLAQLRRGSPDWNAKVISFRLEYVANHIAALAADAAPPPAPAPAKSPAAQSAKETAPAATPTDWSAQLNSLQAQVRQLQEDKANLEAKLKEAFSAQPAAIDPRELAKAQAQLVSLQKENDLLKAGLDAEKAKAARVDQKSLEDTTRQLEAEKQASAKLTTERDALQGRLKTLTAEADAASALRAENELLKSQLATAKSASSAAGTAASDLAAARAQLAALESDRNILRLEKEALESRLKQLAASPSKKSANSRQVQDLQDQLADTRARLAVYEARKVPFTPEELALLNQPAATLPAAADKPVVSRGLSPGSTQLVAEARRHFAAREFDQAEQAYLQVLKDDSHSVAAMADLATVQIQNNHPEAAEINIKQALSLDPQNAYTLFVLGTLKFRQAKYDEALDALSRSVKLDPDNAEAQNFLGLTLSEKGQRGPAEAALRKAIQLNPNYASAHHNLAIIYATQKPPLIELARWHYQKALAGGLQPNPDLEKLFQQPTAAK